MVPPFVKKFDFRGVYGKDIQDSDAYYLGLALEKTIQLKKVLIGWDTRVSSKNLALQFINALKDKNIEICYLDKCPIDYVTSAACVFDYDLSVMFTGSHNPWTWTGLLMHTRGGDSVTGSLVDEIVQNYYTVNHTALAEELPNLSSLKDVYSETEKLVADKIKTLIPLSYIKPMNVLVDVGDGSGSQSLSLLETLLPQVTFTHMHDRMLYDEQSSHVADPSNRETMNELMQRVRIGSYACGVAFDSDSDRMLTVDENGEYMSGSLLGSAQIECFVRLGPSSTVFGYAVDCGPSIYNAVFSLRASSSKAITVKALPVGRSIVRTMIRNGEVDFAVENVGHFYSKDYFKTDSGVFSLACILYWISTYGPLSMLNTKYPDGQRGQLSSDSMTEELVTTIVSAINEKLKDKKMHKIEVDGERYEFFDKDRLISWYAIRKSGYEAITKMYFGSLDQEDFKFLSTTFNTLIPNAKHI